MPLIFLADMSLAERLRDALTLTIVGMGTVFVSLFLMGELFTLLHRYFHGKVERGGPEPASPDDAASATQSVIDPHFLPILVAAATAALGRRVVVRRITFISRNTVSGWGEAGRASIQTSHNLRRTM